MADWNPKNDPYYASLYDKNPFDFVDSWMSTENTLRKRDQEDVINETRKLALEQEQESQVDKRSIREAMQGGGDYRDIARDILRKRGDINGLMKLESEDLRLREVESELDMKQSLREAMQGGGDYRDAARKIYQQSGNISGLLQLDASDDTRANREEIRANRESDRARRANRNAEDDGFSKANASMFMDQRGNIVPVNLRDPSELVKVQQLGLTPYNATQSRLIKEDEERAMRSKKEEGPGWGREILDRIMSENSSPQSSPTPVGSPSPKYSPAPTGSEQVIRVPVRLKPSPSKGIEQR